MKAKYIEVWDKVWYTKVSSTLLHFLKIQLDAMSGIGKVNVAPRDGFPPFPSHFVPCRPHLTAMFIKDYLQNKPLIMRELRSIVSDNSLAVDHQRNVVKLISSS